MTGHTPGPWKTDTSHAHEWEGITIWAGDVVIAHVVSDQHGQEHGNARLIASAPALLAALKDLLGDKPDFVQDAAARMADEFECRHCGRAYAPVDIPETVLDCSEDCPGRIARQAILDAES